MTANVRLTRRRILVGAGACALAAVTTCLPERAFGADQERQQEWQIGQAVFNYQTSQGAIVDTSPYYGILRHIGQKISHVAQPHWYVMNFVVIKDNQANAFSAPGGNVYVTQGLLRLVENEDELANVLGHETAHLVLGHVEAALKQQQHVSAVTKFFENFSHSKGSQNTLDAAKVAANYSYLNFTRQQEYAADQEGALLASKAGYNPWGSVWFQKAFEQLYGNAGFEQYTQQHPSTEDRIAKLTQYIKSNPQQFKHWSSKMTVSSGLPFENQNNRLVVTQQAEP